MNKKSAKLLLNLLVIILLIGGAFLFYKRNSIKADSNLGTFKSEKEINIVLNKKKFRFVIKSYIENGINRNYLIKGNIFKTKVMELIGFEENINSCQKPTPKLNDKEIICLVGDVGVHSQAITFVDENISIVKINKAGIIEKFITSDVPNYLIQDYNNDGYDDLIVDDRDYDNNPMTDVIRTYYLGSTDGFTFDKKELVEVK